MKHTWLLMCAASLVMAACGGGGGGGGNGDNSGGPSTSGDCTGGGWCGSESITVKADLTGSTALFTMQDSNAVVSSESAGKGASKALVSTQSKLYKLLNDGTYKEVISAVSSSKTDAKVDLPLISYIASNDHGDVIVAYQHSFMYRTPDSGYSDPWSPSSPYTCQVFKVKSTLAEFKSDGTAADQGVCCLTNTLEMDTYDYRTNRIQFDSAGNAYFTAHVPQNWKNVLVKWDRSSTPEIHSDGSCTYASTALTEAINANISFRDYLVVPTGGVFYTGSTTTDGQFNHDGSFLRFRADSGALQEITSGWWDYVFQPVGVNDSLDGIDANISAASSVSTSERVIFYGPDPLVATTPNWNDSCLYLYNPNITGATRSTELADCNIDIWNYVNWADNNKTKRTRCSESKYMMGGNNQPKKILISDSYDASDQYRTASDYGVADGVKEIFVVGDIYNKKAGEWRYDLRLEEAHCTIAGIPSYTYADDQSACTNNGGTWVTANASYNQLTDATLFAAVADLTDDELKGSDANWQISSQWCETPGEWLKTYSALARVNYTNSTTKSITFLSATNEIVKNGWAVRDRIYYVAFDVDDGEYKLMELGNTTPLVTGYEMYELFKDPKSSTKLYFNGLKFSNNSYVMGTFDPDRASSTLQEEAGITGQIETLVVIPDNLLQ